jgi:hypothetical protein
MAGGNGEGEGGEAVVELDEAVKLLVEHLVQPVLPRHAHRWEEAMVPEKQETVARQVRFFTFFARGRWVRGSYRRVRLQYSGVSPSSRIVDLGSGFGSRVVFHVWMFFFGIRGL